MTMQVGKLLSMISFLTFNPPGTENICICIGSELHLEKKKKKKKDGKPQAA